MKIPIIGIGREPGRWALFMALALSVLIGFLLTFLNQKHPRWQPWLIGIGLLVYIELIAIPVKLDDRLVTMPKFYRRLAQQTSSQSGAILDVPYDLYGAIGPACNYMVYQIVHQRPIVSGYISRAPQSAVRMLDGYPFVRQLRGRLYGDSEPVNFTEASIYQGLSELRTLGVEYVILHKTELPAADAQLMIEALTQAISQPIHNDNRIVVWQIPP
jgi:hypothetical protein